VIYDKHHAKFVLNRLLDKPNKWSDVMKNNEATNVPTIAPEIHHFMIDLWRVTSCVLILLLTQ
jgi:hypothetical protein